MIRRISNHNDLKDLIKSCPTGVIDDIYAIEYYIQGHPETIQENFTKKGSLLEVILPSSDLETLPNGILMRRAFYKVLDASYPDGYYNLEFEDNLNVWLGEVESEAPEIPEYVTEEELAEILGDYATTEDVTTAVSDLNGRIDLLDSRVSTLESDPVTKSYVDSENSAQNAILTNISSSISSINTKDSQQDESIRLITDAVTVNSSRINSIEQAGYVTGQWVMDQHFATQSWVTSHNYITENDMNRYLVNNSYLTEGNVDEYLGEQGYYVVNEGEAVITDANMSIYSIATENWVQSQGYLTSHQDLTGYATESWVQSQGYLTSHQDLSSYATQSWVSAQGYLTSHQDLTGYATESWVQSQGYLTSHQDLGSYATQSWVQSQGYLTSHQDLTGYATESWVQNRGYLTVSSIPSDLATQSWVSSQQFATQSWVSAQGYLTSHQNLSSYATKSWVSTNFLEESKVWTGTMADWLALTSEQRVGYTIALITD